METGNPILAAIEGQPLDLRWAEQTVRDHPTCALVAALALREGSQSNDLRTALVLGAADRQAFADYAGLHGDWYGFYPPAAADAPKSTDAVLASFIDTYGKSSPEEDALIERLIFNPVAPDYDLSAYDDGTDAPTDLIAAGTETTPTPTPSPAPAYAAPEPPQEPTLTPSAPPDTSLMESLAKFFVKQGRYSRAFEIISELNLKYPEKSVYFADQLRFLQKLMVNQQYQQHSKQ